MNEPYTCDCGCHEAISFWQGLARLVGLVLVMIAFVTGFIFLLAPLNYYIEVWTRRWVP